MRAEELASLLGGLGMAPDEATTYVQLQRLGPAAASTLAKALHVSRQRVYRSLEALAFQGFVQTDVGRPRLYAPTSPQNLVQVLRLRLHTLSEKMDRAQADIVGPLEELRGGPSGQPGKTQFTVVRGLDALTGQAHQMWEDASATIDLLFTQQGGPELFHRLGDLRDLEWSAQQGVKVRLLLRQPTGSDDPDVPWPPQTAEVRFVDTDVLSTFMLADGRDSLLVVTSDLAAGPRAQADLSLAFRTNAGEFVAMQRVLFERLWQSGQPIDGGKNRRSGKGLRQKRRS